MNAPLDNGSNGCDSSLGNDAPGHEGPVPAVKNKSNTRKRTKDHARWTYYAKSITYLLGWSVMSGLIILLNNWIMNYDGFPFPITISATGPLFSWLVAAVLVLTGHTKLQRKMTFKMWLQYVFPIGFFTAVTYATGNALYLFLSVSFIQMMKSLSPIVVFFLLAFFRLDVVTYPKLAGVFLMSFGMVVACYTEPSFSVKGLVLMFVGEAAEAMRMVFFQRLLGAQQLGLIEGLFYTCPANFFFLCIGIVIFEEQRLMEEQYYTRVLEKPLLYFAVSSLGFFVILTTLGVIQLCGSLTFKAAGQVRNLGIIFIGIAMFGDRVTLKQSIGYAINVLGFAVYQFFKTKEDVQMLHKEVDDSFAAEGSSGGDYGGGGTSGGVNTPLLEKGGNLGLGLWPGPFSDSVMGTNGRARRDPEEPESQTIRGNYVQIRAGAELGAPHD